MKVRVLQVALAFLSVGVSCSSEDDGMSETGGRAGTHTSGGKSNGGNSGTAGGRGNLGGTGTSGRRAAGQGGLPSAGASGGGAEAGSEGAGVPQASGGIPGMGGNGAGGKASGGMASVGGEGGDQNVGGGRGGGAGAGEGGAGGMDGARLVVLANEVIVSEIMWQTVSGSVAGPDDGQFVELHNTTDEALSVENCRLTGLSGEAFYLDGVIAPRGYFLVGATSNCCGAARPDDSIENPIWDRTGGSGQVLFSCDDPNVPFLPKFTRVFMQMTGISHPISVGHSQYVDCSTETWAPDSAMFAEGRYGTPRSANTCSP